MDLELATVPLTRFQVRTRSAPGRASPCGSRRDDPDSVEIRFFDDDGRRHRRGAQRKIERLLYREDFRRAFAADIGDIVLPAAGRSSSTRPRSRAPSTPTALRRRRSRSCSTTRSAPLARDAVRARQDRRRRAGGQPVRGDRSARSRFDDARPAPRTSATSCAPRGRTSASCSTPTARRVTYRRRGPRRSRDTEALLAIVKLVCRPPARRQHRAAGLGEPRGRAHRRRRRASRSLDEALGCRI